MPDFMTSMRRGSSRIDQDGQASRLVIYTTWGKIQVVATHGCVCACHLPQLRREPRRPFRWRRAVIIASRARDRAVLIRARRYLQKVLEGEKATPPPLAPLSGTRFMRQVWRSLAEIPKGMQITYGEIAKKMGYMTGSCAARAVGRACRANPLPLFIPCHRVVSADGTLGGFSAGEAWKRLVLGREKVRSTVRSAIRTASSNKRNRSQ